MSGTVEAATASIHSCSMRQSEHVLASVRTAVATSTSPTMLYDSYEMLGNVYASCSTSPSTKTILGTLIISEEFLHGVESDINTFSVGSEDVIILCSPRVQMAGQQLWPPPLQLKLMRDRAALRPGPWPSFSCVLQVLFSLEVLKHNNAQFLEPELIASKLSIRFLIKEFVNNFHNSHSPLEEMAVPQIISYMLAELAWSLEFRMVMVVTFMGLFHGTAALPPTCRNLLIVLGQKEQSSDCNMLISVNIPASSQLDSQWYMPLLVSFELSHELFKFLGAVILIICLDIMQVSYNMNSELWYIFPYNANIGYLLTDVCEMLRQCELLVKNT